MANRPSRLVVSIPTASGDGKYYGRYPNGNAPLGPGALAATASDTSSATGALTTGGGGLAKGWTDPIPSGEVGIPYSYTLTATGGVPPYTYAVESGTLPAGLSLNPSTGVISGIPTTVAIFDAVTFEVTDSA